MQTLTGASTFPYERLNPTTGAATSGDGTITPSSTDVSVTFGTVTTSARFSHTVVSGQRYRVIWTQTGSSNAQAGFGTSAGGSQYRPTLVGSQGTTFDFTATSTTLWVNFQRVNAGTTVFSDILITPIAEPTWSAVSPAIPDPATWTLAAGATINSGTITIVASGSAVTARNSFTTVAGKLYRLSHTVGTTTVFSVLGTSAGASTFKSSGTADAVGAVTFEFVPTGTTTHLQYSRTVAGTTVISNIVIQEAV